MKAIVFYCITMSQNHWFSQYISIYRLLLQSENKSQNYHYILFQVLLWFYLYLYISPHNGPNNIV